jgi:hypothetical protein
LLLFVVHNKGYFASNIVYHKFNTRPFWGLCTFLYDIPPS